MKRLREKILGLASCERGKKKNWSLKNKKKGRKVKRNEDLISSYPF
jgi:hypothetical protein